MITYPEGERRGRIFTEILGQVVFGHLVDHPVVAVTDPADRVFLDPNGFPLDANHPELGEVLSWELGTARREEVAWLELTLVPGASGMPRLITRGADGNADVFSEGGGSISGGLAGAIGAWLEARGLPPASPLAHFSADELRKTAFWLEGLVRQANDPEQSTTILIAPPVQALAAAALRALARVGPPDPDYVAQVNALILDIDPEDTIALHDQLARAPDGPPRSEARRLLPFAPQWYKLHLLIAATGGPIEEALRHTAAAAVLAPESPLTAEAESRALLRAGRAEDAAHAAARAVSLAPRGLRGRAALVRALRAAGRPGDAFRASQELVAVLDEEIAADNVTPEEARAHRHLHAMLHVDLGRLDEGVTMSRQALDTAPAATLGDERADLEAWQTDPAYLAACYAREGHYRHELGRVLEGFGRARPLDERDVAILIDALVLLGRDDLASLAYAREVAAGRARGPLAWLAGARAALLAGHLDECASLVARTVLRAGAERVDGIVLRLLRLYATRPVAEWEALINDRLESGAPTLARLLARDVADFVPGAGGGRLSEALGARRRRDFEDAWLAPLAQLLDVAKLDGITTFFASKADDTLADADFLVDHWLELVPPDASDETRASLVAWIFAQAMARYLAATTQAPTPLAGGLRQVASEALDLLERNAGAVPMGVGRALLEVFDGAARDIDPWIFDRWLLRLERALALEDQAGGHLGPFTAGLPLAGEHLRGPERIAFELRLAVDLKDDGDPTNDDEARVLYERSQRATGTGDVAVGWSEVTAGLMPAVALDVHYTTATIEPYHPSPHLNLARGLFAAGKAERAFEALLVGMPLLLPAAREQRLAELEPLWARSTLKVPIDWTAAQDVGLAHLDAGRAAEAARCFRWCNAIDPGNPGMLKNLGVACAALGLAKESVAAFSEMDASEGLKLAGHALVQAGQRAEGVAALRAAALGSTQSLDWAQLGSAAYYAEDDETAAEAFERAHQLASHTHERLSAEELDGFAGALLGSGLYQRAEQIAGELIAAASSDPTLRARGQHAMAKALLGQGRVVEAVPHAQRALADNPVSDDAAEMAETLSRATRGEPYPQQAPKAGPAARAFAALAAGDVAVATSIAAASRDWGAARAGLVAAALRTDSETAVSFDALRAIGAAIDASEGSTDRDTALWRAHALALRADAWFPRDTPPPFGPRLDRSELERLLADRSEEDEPTIMREVPEQPSGPIELNTRELNTLMIPNSIVDDIPIFPGTKIPRLSDYVKVMKAMRGADPLGTLAKLGLDMAGYAQLATDWGQKLASDPVLSARFTEKMTE